jgi:hypothetical protein
LAASTLQHLPATTTLARALTVPFASQDKLLKENERRKGKLSETITKMKKKTKQKLKPLAAPLHANIDRCKTAAALNLCPDDIRLGKLLAVSMEEIYGADPRKAFVPDRKGSKVRTRARSPGFLGPPNPDSSAGVQRQVRAGEQRGQGGGRPAQQGEGREGGAREGKRMKEEPARQPANLLFCGGSG